ncbi:hydroxymethylglutaryl-CoA lyase [Peribacillus deserti]|uniref:Hydroxymethylglutaryl-CoA lyase n=1 Tax=Peribacillus deserti TaxID=673318 RepID=A0ABS2QDX4_9BACI|nr:hydroxymethylglutaryl-CoA lyase [Peribacillus deserti]MBM7691367.1 hydroxymethylglutaryl-CoA lyase [Peribacillus deserti]
MRWPEKVKIKEVGPRDGLQNEKKIIPSDTKIGWIDSLSETGLSYIEVTSFVNPKWIPQLADSLEVAKGIRRNPGVTYAALVPNLKGLEGALEANMDEIAVFMSTSESHNQKNINKSIQDTYPVLHETVKLALQEGKKVRGYLSTVFGCPYEGRVSMDQVMTVCDRLFEMGIDELSLGDTIGVANPRQVEEVLENCLKNFKGANFALHFHDTRGMALANILKALEMGFDTFDSALGGLGGCPYAPGASGNVATDDLVHMLEKMGIDTGIEQDKLLKAGSFLQQKMHSRLPSHQMAVYNAAKA